VQTAANKPGTALFSIMRLPLHRVAPDGESERSTRASRGAEASWRLDVEENDTFRRGGQVTFVRVCADIYAYIPTYIFQDASTYLYMSFD